MTTEHANVSPDFERRTIHRPAHNLNGRVKTTLHVRSSARERATTPATPFYDFVHIPSIHYSGHTFAQGHGGSASSAFASVLPHAAFIGGVAPRYIRKTVARRTHLRRSTVGSKNSSIRTACRTDTGKTNVNTISRAI